jgi:hypothetical protein
VALTLTLALAPRAPAGTEVFALDPESGPAGTKLTITGKGLATTKHVAFAVGQTVKPARFRVVSDRALEVIAPEYYRPQAAATVAVFTPSGVAVAMPAAAQTVRTTVPGHNVGEPGASLYHVLAGGVVANAGSVAVIEEGGLVQRGSTAGMHFVKRGGALLDYDNPSGIVFREPGAVIGPALAGASLPPTFYTVPVVSVSPGVGPFRYQAVPRPDPGNAPPGPPGGITIAPRAAAAGDIITLSGRGFARTASVRFKDPYAPPRPAGFRIVSDRELKVEVPDERPRPGPQLLLVSSTEGLTLTVPRDRTVRPALARARRTSADLPVYYVAPGDVADMDGGGAIFVERGGLVTRALGNSVVLIKDGGRADVGLGGAGAVYYEPDADLPDALKNGRNAQEVPRIVPSFFPSPFVLLPGPVFRK